MTTWVVDASVAVKWALPVKDRVISSGTISRSVTRHSGGQGSHSSTSSLDGRSGSRVDPVGPKAIDPHASDVSRDGVAITTEWEVYEQACRLSVDLNHHLFDTLYHAVALQSSDTFFITADVQYFRKASQLGRIIELKDFSVKTS